MGEHISNLVRKPDADPHVRFDERDLETETLVRYSDTDNRKGRKQLWLNLPLPRQISTLPST